MPPTSRRPADNDSSALVSDAVARWRLDLARIGDRDALLHYVDLPVGTLDLATAHPGGLAQFLAGRPTRLSNLFREPAAHAAARRSARAIRTTVSQLAEQHGLDAGRLAVGMVRWPGPDGPGIVAPVLLRPLTLRPRGAGQVDDDVDLGEEVTVNPALVRLLARHGVFVDPAEVRLLASGKHGFAPRPALEHVQQLTHGLVGLTVTDRTVVGTFVDLAPALVGDLDLVADSIPSLPLVAALAGDPEPLRDAEQPPVPDRPGDLAEHIFELDPGQLDIVRDVVAGHSRCVLAAPGTGATQLLAAVVAAMAATGRRTLLVAPQRCELDDVRDRLGAAGLGGLVHDPRPDDVPRPAAPHAAEAGSLTAALHAERAAREGVVARHTALHASRAPWGVSVADALDRLTVLSSSAHPPSTRVRLSGDVLARLAQSRDVVTADLAEAAELGAFSAATAATPWYGARLAGPDQAREALAAVNRLTASVAELRTTTTRLAADVGLSTGSSVAELRRQVDLLVAVRATLDDFNPAVYERSVDRFVDATGARGWRSERGVRMSPWERSRWRRQALTLLRPSSEVKDLHGALVRAQAEQAAWLVASTSGGWPRVPTGLVAADELAAAVVADVNLLDGVLTGTSQGAGLLDMTLAALVRRLARLASDPAALEALPRRDAVLGRLHAAGVGELCDDLFARSVDRARVGDELELAWWTSVLQAALASEPVPGHAGDLAAARRRLRAVEVAHAAGAASAMALPACTLLSPLALPHLPAGADLVVVAGAHRVGVAEGVLAIARGRQVLVVGDPLGMSPCSIRLSPDTADAAPPGPVPVREALMPAVQRLLPVRRLRRQHRMPAELAALGALVNGVEPDIEALPAPADAPTWSLELLAGGRGVPDAEAGVDSTDDEVQHVVSLVLEHARTEPGRSLAVVAVTRRHARRIAEALRAELPERPDVASFFTRPRGAPFVVTDLLRCEDAIRDDVVLAVGFGRTPHGRVLHRFGVLDAAGGQRLLGVAVSRARRRLHVVSCLTAQDLDPDRLRTDGSRALRVLLGSTPAVDSPAGRAAHVALLADLSRRLSEAGALVHPGRAGIDLVVTRPGGGRSTAVLSDVAPARDATDLVERELSLPGRLERMGWRVAHVTALGLFTDPDGTVAAVCGHLGLQGVGAALPAVVPAASPAAGTVIERSADDSDVGWGETPDDDDERFTRERPPHW